MPSGRMAIGTWRDVFIFWNINAADIPATDAPTANVSADDEVFHEIFQEQKQLQEKSET